MLHPLTTKFICRANETLTREFPGVYQLIASGGPFPAIWGFSEPRRPGLRVGICTDGGEDWDIYPGSRRGKPIALFLYPARRNQAKGEDWHYDIPSDQRKWGKFLREIVREIREWRRRYVA